MVENDLGQVCPVTQAPPARREVFSQWTPIWPGLPATPLAWLEQLQTFRQGWAETFLEVLKRLRDSAEEQLEATLRTLEAGFRTVAARKPEEFRARLVEFWQKSFDCLRPVAEMQLHAARFSEALGRHVAGGMEAVSEAEYQRRLAVCSACEFFRDGVCLKCGCRLAGDVVAKARWASEQCPEGKWDSIHLVPGSPKPSRSAGL
jgi:hypothetical protein